MFKNKHQVAVILGFAMPAAVAGIAVAAASMTNDAQFSQQGEPPTSLEFYERDVQECMKENGFAYNLYLPDSSSGNPNTARLSGSSPEDKDWRASFDQCTHQVSAEQDRQAEESKEFSQALLAAKLDLMTQDDSLKVQLVDPSVKTTQTTMTMEEFLENQVRYHELKGQYASCLKTAGFDASTRDELVSRYLDIESPDARIDGLTPEEFWERENFASKAETACNQPMVDYIISVEKDLYQNQETLQIHSKRLLAESSGSHD